MKVRQISLLKFTKISIFSLISDEGCNIDESEDGDEDEDVHVCGSCKSAFGNVGKQEYLFWCQIKLL